MNLIQHTAIGADPEVLLLDVEGHAVSSEGKFGGTKANPKKMQGLPEGFFIQEDNVAVEYNIPPCTQPQEFSVAIAKGLRYIKNAAKKHKLTVAVVPALHFSMKELNTPHAQLLGCEADLNVWTMKQNPRPIPPKTLRTAAGHIHFSWSEPDDFQRQFVAKLGEIYVTLASVLVTDASERRSLYGQAGAARFKWYGVEVRSPDNFWIDVKPYREHIALMYQQMVRRINREKEFLLELITDYESEIQDAINNHDKDLAIKLMRRLDVPSFPVFHPAG